jgi:hypothetical protein
MTWSLLVKAWDGLLKRSNASGECFGGEILDCWRDASVALGAGSVELVFTRGVLVLAREAEGAQDPQGLLQDYENRIPVSEALRYLRRALAGNSKSKAVGSGCDETFYYHTAGVGQ